MKKTYLAFGVLLAAVGSTLALDATHQGLTMQDSSTTPAMVSAPIVSAPAADQKVGVSIGTVEAQLYSESGLSLSNFYDATYVAQTSDGTYMGFSVDRGWVYDEETGEESLVDYIALVAIDSTEEAVTIPDFIKIGEYTYPVTRIYGYSSLRDGFNSNIKYLTIPSTVNYVYMSYQFDRYLDAIYMLGDAPYFGEYGAFQVSKIYVCDKTYMASYLNNGTFSNSAVIPYGWDFEWITVNVEKNGEFAETYLTQNDYDWGAAQYVKVVGNINDIDLSAIKNLTTLMKLDLSETTIKSLPEQFMYNRSSLVEVKLPATLKSIGNSAFYGCSALQSFDLNGITTIGSSVFSGCHSLSNINLTGVQTIGNSAFSNCTKLNNIDLSTVNHIGFYAFQGCSSLESVDLSSAVNIGNENNYDGSSFANCSSLREVKFGKALQNLSQRSFQNTAIETVSIPEGLTKISNYVFENCVKLISVELPSSIENIGYEAFNGCSLLSSVIMGTGLKDIGSSAFAGCSSLTSVEMKTGLSTIGNSAFYGCYSLEEVTIPSTVTSIGQNAFGNTGIKNFKCYAVVPPTATSSFIGQDMDMSRTYLYVPPFSKDFYRNTQYWSDFNLMRSLEDQVDYIIVDRPLTINLEEEDNYVVANNPEIVLSASTSYNQYGDYIEQVGQLTATGEGTLSAGQMTVNATLAKRSQNYYQSCPTLINYADKMRADNLTINMWLSDYNYGDPSSGYWHFISLPYDVKVSDIVPSNDTYWVIRRYDSAARAAGETSSTWVNLTNDDTLEAGKGYIISAYGGETFTTSWGGTYKVPRLSFTSGNSVTKNNLFRSTDIVVSLTEYAAEFPHNRSWNLIGNPYPCYFDMHYLNEEFTAPVTIWNGSSYVAYSPVDDDLVLSPYEAFFVQCPLDATEMTFKEGGRMHSDEGKPLYKSPAMGKANVSVEDRNVFNFELSSENFSDRARIVMNADASMDYEIGRDASKFFADNSEFAQIYVAADVNYSISERPVGEGTATLGIRASKEETYTLSLTGRYNADWHVIVTDNLTGISVDLTEEDYQFTTANGDSNSRFSVRFQLGNQTGIESVIADFGNNALVNVTALNGVNVYTGSLSEINVPSAGLYVISNGKESRKVIIK